MCECLEYCNDKKFQFKIFQMFIGGVSTDQLPLDQWRKGRHHDIKELLILDGKV